MTNATTTHYTVRIINDRWFAKSLKEAKRIGGLFNAETKTWAIPAANVKNDYSEVTDTAKWLKARGMEMVG